MFQNSLYLCVCMCVHVCMHAHIHIIHIGMGLFVQHHCADTYFSLTATGVTGDGIISYKECVTHSANLLVACRGLFVFYSAIVNN